MGDAATRLKQTLMFDLPIIDQMKCRHCWFGLELE